MSVKDAAEEIRRELDRLREERDAVKKLMDSIKVRPVRRLLRRTKDRVLER
jgi:histone H3/H4